MGKRDYSLKESVEQHKGFITADNELSKEALFTVILPVSQHREVISVPAEK